MSTKMGLPLLALSLLILSSLAVASKGQGREFDRCQHQCRERFDRGPRQECERRCEDYFPRRDDFGIEDSEQDRCQQQCERLEGSQERALCRLRCQKGNREGDERREQWERERERERGMEMDKPYVFDAEEFEPIVQTEHGFLKILKRFQFESDLLWHLKNYRMALMEIEPLTFVTPTHLDTDVVFFVARGRGAATFVMEEKEENVNLNEGDVVFVPAGSSSYVTNTDNNENFVVIKLFKTVNAPGLVGIFSAQGGGEQYQSYYDAFSEDILQSVFKEKKEKLRQILQRNKEIMVKATREQIQSLTRREETPRIWPFSRESIGSFNLFKRLVHRNNYGELFEATPEDVRQLRGIDVAVSFANMTQGSVSGPFYNTRSTKIAFVLDGEGFVEIICPHKQNEIRKEQSRGPLVYRNVRSKIRRGSVFVVPAGHPVATVASRDHLLVICFEINAQFNNRYQLAGKRNVFKNLDDTAKELTFGSPAREVDQILNKVNEEFFFRWSRQEHGHQRVAYE